MDRSERDGKDRSERDEMDRSERDGMDRWVESAPFVLPPERGKSQIGSNARRMRIMDMTDECPTGRNGCLMSKRFVQKKCETPVFF